MSHIRQLPSSLMNINKRLNTVSIKEEDITSIIKSINAVKAHGFDNFSIRMIQLFRDPITLPLVQVFKSRLSQSVFSDKWKMTNIIPVQKKR